MGKKARRWVKPDIINVVADTKASDADVRGEGVRGFCPCHAGWEVFEQNIRVVLRGLGLNALVFRFWRSKSGEDWNVDKSPPVVAKISAAFSLLAWSAVISCGRLLAFF